MMNPMTDNILDDLRRFARTVDVPKRRELHCGRAAWDVLRNVSDKTTDVLGLTAAHLPATGLYGMPVYIDADMPDAAWRLTEDGETVASGDMAPGHRHAAYVPGVGLVAWPDVFRKCDPDHWGVEGAAAPITSTKGGELSRVPGGPAQHASA